MSRRACPPSGRLRVEPLEGRTLMSTIPVTTTTDGGPGSLRQAVIDANKSPGADTITLPAGTYTLTLSGTGEDAAATGDLDITGDLTVQGAGADKTIIDGGALDNVFQAIGAISANFSGVSIRNAGRDSDGILADQADINVSNCSFRDNPTADILTKSGDITATNCSFNGIKPLSQDTDALVTFQGNLTAANDTFRNYKQAISAGGNPILNKDHSGSATVTGCTFLDNFDALGANVPMTITNTTISGNSNIGIDGADTVTIKDSHIDNNGFEGIDGTDTLTLINSTIIGNGSSGDVASGDGIDGVENDLTMINSIISNNGLAPHTPDTTGDGIDGVGGTLTMTNSTISNNGADGIDGVETMTMTGSTISGNKHAGIEGYTLKITNSTISGNGHDGIMGASVTSNNTETDNGAHDVTLSFSTIANNQGVGLFADHVTVGNSILSTPSGGTNLKTGSLTSLGHNISNDATGASVLTMPGDRNNTDPMLAPLADNGGPTQTHALLPGSPAIDAASASGSPTADQRGIARPQGTGLDIGAFEFQSSAPSPTSNLAISSASVSPSPTATVGDTLTYTVHVLNNGPDPAHHVLVSASLPAGIAFVSANADLDHTITRSGNTITIALDSLGAGQSVTATFIGTASAPGTQTVSVHTSADETDPDSANNTTSLTISASAPPTPAPSPTPTPSPSPTPTSPPPSDIVGPVVVDLSRFGYHAQPTFLVVTFNEALDPARAANPANYVLRGPFRPGWLGPGIGPRIAIASARYDPAIHSVILRPARRLKLREPFQLTINGSAPAGLTDRSGNLLDGNADGRPGGDFSSRITQALLAGSASRSGPRTPFSLAHPEGQSRFFMAGNTTQRKIGPAMVRTPPHLPPHWTRSASVAPKTIKPHLGGPVPGPGR